MSGRSPRLRRWAARAAFVVLTATGALGVPYVFVRGNHDSSTTEAAVAAQPNGIVLDDDATEVAGVRFWGIGDPRFTPDKTEGLDVSEEREAADAFAPRASRRLRRHGPVDVAVVHDPRVAADFGGIVPIVLAGHLHDASMRDLADGTLLLVEGSTGGAGLRALQKDEPVPLVSSVLHLDRDDKTLQAIDRITVSGLGDAGARIERRVIADDADDDAGSP